MLKTLFSLDSAWFLFINRRTRCASLDWLLPKITHLGSAQFTLGLFVLIGLVNGFTHSLVVDGLLALIAGHAVVHLLKVSFSRKRPFDHLSDIFIVGKVWRDPSFPSGHTAAAFCMMATLAFNFPLLIVLFPIALLVAISRVYMGMHFPLDTFVGGFIGLMSAYIFYLL